MYFLPTDMTPFATVQRMQLLQLNWIMSLKLQHGGVTIGAVHSAALGQTKTGYAVMPQSNLQTSPAAEMCCLCQRSLKTVFITASHSALCQYTSQPPLFLHISLVEVTH